MKKLLLVLAIFGGTMFSTIEAKENKTSNLEKDTESVFFCKVVTTRTSSITINSDGSSTQTITITRTFYPCSN